jgi:hypothetical protein
MHKAVNKRRRIRKIGAGKTGDVFGVTIPAYIKEQFESVLFSVAISGNCIVLESGCQSG